MRTIDSDAHVIETMRTWSYLDDSEKAYMPQVVSRTEGVDDFNVDGIVKRNYWVVNRRIHDKEQNLFLDVAENSREMRDVQARIVQMDELEIDVQVLFSTLTLRPFADRAAIEFVLCRSYNRGLADI